MIQIWFLTRMETALRLSRMDDDIRGLRTEDSEFPKRKEFSLQSPQNSRQLDNILAELRSMFILRRPHRLQGQSS